jgi:hypothetical protein
MVSVRNCRSVLHKNSVQESVLELFSGLALEKVVESGRVIPVPRKSIDPALMPAKCPCGADS